MKNVMPNHVSVMNKRFVFRVGKNPKNISRVLADNYNQAANIVARRLFGKVVSAIRIWGFPEFSGYFQAYKKDSATGEIRMIESPFHLQMLANTDNAQSVQDAYQMYNGLQYIRKRDLK